MKKPLVSIIVPSFNSAATIGRCLQSLKKQTYKRIEIIVVDRDSTDGTKKIAKRYTSLVYNVGPERAAQVNAGARKAKGTYLYRVDSDFIVDPGVVSQCVATCEDCHLDGVAVHNTSSEGLGFWAEVRKFERNTYIDDSLIVAVRFFSRKSWETIDGFDETLYGPEDYDFHNRFIKADFKWGRITAQESHLGEPKSIKDIWQKHFFYGKQMVPYFTKHPAHALLQFNPIRTSFFRHFRIILRHPILLSGLVVMTVVKFTAGGLGFLVALVTRYNPNQYYEPEQMTKRLYGGLGWVSIFTHIRFWTGSFVELEQYIPEKGEIVDLGCGYGIFSNYLAVCSPQRVVIGVDTDRRKIVYGNRGISHVSFREGDVTKMKYKKLDAIILHDVLHHLNSKQEQEDLVKNIVTMLNRFGVAVIVEVDSNPLWKLILGRITDFILYRGSPVYYRYKKDILGLLEKYFQYGQIRVKRLRNSPFSQNVYICKKM